MIGNDVEEPERVKLATGTWQVLEPSYLTPLKKRKRLILRPNVLRLVVSGHQHKRSFTHTSQEERPGDDQVTVEAQGVININNAPRRYQARMALRKLCARFIKRLRAAKLRVPLIPIAVQDKILKACSEEDAESSSSYEEGVDKARVQQLMAFGELAVEYSLPIKFQLKQNLHLMTSIKKESNKLCDLSEFRRQQIDVYITTDPEETPGPAHYQLHKRFNFDIPKSGYSKEYEVNPRFTFMFNLNQANVLSDRVFVRIVGSKPCEMELIAQPSLGRSMHALTQHRPAMRAESVKRANEELDTFLTENTAVFGSDESALNFIKKNIEKVLDKDHREFSIGEESRQQLLRLVSMERALSARNYVKKEEVVTHENLERHAARWDKYRAERDQQQLKGIALVRAQARARLLLTFMC